MAFNGSGTYVLPGPALVTGEIVSATENNAFRNDVASGLTLCVTRDGQSPATADLPMGNHKLTGLAVGTSSTDASTIGQVQAGEYAYLTSVSGTNTITASVAPAFAAYVAGQTFRFVSAGANTNATTLNVNSLGAKAITKLGTTALIAGDIPSGSIVEVVYDGTQFQLVGLVATNIAGGSEGQIPVQSASGSTVFMDSSFGFKNRIINGAIMIDRRNAGASVAANNSVYFVDRYVSLATQTAKATLQQVSVAPVGFTNSIAYTSSSAYSVLSSDYFGFGQYIEGFNTADFGWGTADAQPVTLSFIVRSSLTGTFGGSLRNNAGDRSCPFSYTISAANTWEYKTITITGDTSGTWLTNNSIGVRLVFSMGAGSTWSGASGAWAGANYLSATGATSVVGTNGATFYITGIQLEKGSTATSFDYRPYGTELALCQRYYQNGSVLTNTNIGTYGYPSWTFPVQMRSSPSITSSGNGDPAFGVFPGGVGFYQNNSGTNAGGTTVWTATSEL